ncbi:RNApolymerase 14 kDa subunit [Striga asiatica]|uniref:RNApolymerase 14 kDa subunit n=1 Tax=Striga asiatica TaxID=4170 RepID=A0A5A7QEM1_STRAF|nr:RNApolymerase 14 kDa subunit [Striga asiatica]
MWWLSKLIVHSHFTNTRHKPHPTHTDDYRPNRDPTTTVPIEIRPAPVDGALRFQHQKTADPHMDLQRDTKQLPKQLSKPAAEEEPAASRTPPSHSHGHRDSWRNTTPEDGLAGRHPYSTDPNQVADVENPPAGGPYRRKLTPTKLW